MLVHKAVFTAVLEERTVYVPNLSESSGFTRTGLFAEEGFTTYYAVPLIAKGRILGVLEIFHRSPHEDDSEWREFLETLARQIAIAIDNAELFHKLERSNIELIQAYDGTIEALSYALDLRDKETEGHSRRVTELTLRIARKMGVKEEELVHIRRGALLHDIGKMGIPDAILPAARIFAVVDVIDALTNDRPYRKAWPMEKAFEYLREQSGKHFDPRVVEVFLFLAERNLLFEGKGF